MTGLIEIKDITVAYGRHVALQDVSGAFQAGSLTAIAGPNGAGKSTLLKAIVGIAKPTKGRVVFNGVTPERIAYLPQTASLQRDFPLTVLQAACTGFWREVGNQKAIDASRMIQAQKALDEVGLTGLENRLIGELSGGQFQRLLFARVILQNAPVILLDEPFTAVDAATTARLIQIMLDWHRQGRTIICVLHDLLLIQKYFPDSFVLAGKCLGHGHTHQMLEQKLLSFDLDMAELCPGTETPAHMQHEEKRLHDEHAPGHVHDHRCGHSHDH